MKVKEFQKLFPTREDKEKALSAMNDNEIDERIADSNNIYGKIFYSKFKSCSRKKKVLLTAEHQNWGLQTTHDWHQTKFILFEDGTLQQVIFVGEEIISSEWVLGEEEVTFVKDNIKEFIYNTDEIDACDGDAWCFEGPDFEYDLGYIYGSNLEKIASILEQ